MKRLFTTIMIMAAVLMTAVAWKPVQKAPEQEVKVSQVKVSKGDGRLVVTLEMDAAALKVRSDQEVMFTPFIQAGDSVEVLDPICFVGRNRHFRNLRNNEMHTRSPYYIREGKEEQVSYQCILPYKDWMEEAELVLEDSRCGCHRKLLSEKEEQLAFLDFRSLDFIPEFVYLVPEIQEKTRQASGSAFIDFEIDRIEIKENFRGNAGELHKIMATIDSVKNNPDFTINQIWIKGFASPDGPYDRNERLARDRTRALNKYVQQHYAFPDSVMVTAYEPEDWAGLCAGVEATELQNREAILALAARKNLTPDQKEQLIRKDYPDDFQYIRDYIYPTLRRSDYTVSYTIRAYVDIEEAKEIMKTRPGNLSQYEFYKIAETCPQGSDEYNEVFMTMAHVYPMDEAANLNAANVSMSLRELKSAEQYLRKAGDSAEAEYARGLQQALSRNWDEASKHFEKAKQGGITQAEAALSQLDGLRTIKKEQSENKNISNNTNYEKN